jgi:radical SAM protein with 4Fe4S-binding SPASM domain
MVSIKVVLERLYRKYKRKYIKQVNSMTKNTICAVPWMHLNFEPNGKVVPCCLTSHHDYFAGDLNTQRIEEIWNSDNMKNLRKQFLAGEEPKICSTCFDREKVTGESGRYYQNKEFPNVIKIIPEITQPDGSVPDMKLLYWDFRFSNLCNLKCRSCGPRYSSAWVPDYKKLGWADQEKVWNIESVENKTNYDFLKDQVQYVQKVYFAGGEPLLMPEHWQTLDLLVEHKRFDVKINYNTNCSTLVYGGKNVLDYWRQWEPWKIEVWPSIDEIGERAELIRSGTVWSKIEENLKLLTTLDNITVRPGMTIGAWNVRRLPVIINHLIDIGVVCEKHKYQNFFINLLEHPTHYHVHIMPDDYRQETIAELKEFIAQHNKKYNTTIDHIFTHILHELAKPWDEYAAQKFIWNTKKVDEVRGEDTYKTIPEMNIVKDIIAREVPL